LCHFLLVNRSIERYFDLTDRIKFLKERREMKKILFLVFVAALGYHTVFAQQAKRSYVGPTQNPKSKKSAPKLNQSTNTRSKAEVYIGYSGTSAQSTVGSGFSGSPKQVHHGVQTSLTLNVNRFVGLRGDYSVGYKDQAEAFGVLGRPFTTVTRRTTIYNILGGVQFKDYDSDGTVQPFGHALVGVGLYRQSLRDCKNPIGTFCGTAIKGSGLAGAFGGGFDFRIARRAGIRVVSDYNPMRIEKETINNFRFGVGMVFK
jgi:hypothetical protein